jgi:hypothetical protein
MSERMRAEADVAIRDISEGNCPLCRVGLVIHDGRGCCPCCGDAYKAGLHRLEVQKCSQHGRTCEHWEAVWAP